MVDYRAILNGTITLCFQTNIVLNRAYLQVYWMVPLLRTLPGTLLPHVAHDHRRD
jgi:hypothetical protein